MINELITIIALQQQVKKNLEKAAISKSNSFLAHHPGFEDQVNTFYKSFRELCCDQVEFVDGDSVCEFDSLNIKCIHCGEKFNVAISNFFDDLDGNEPFLERYCFYIK